MALPPPPKALLFDVFGTCVDWRKTVVEELDARAHAALGSATAFLATSVRVKATDMTLASWDSFAQEWRNTYKRFCKSIAADPSLGWKTVDAHHYDALHELLAVWKLEGLWDEEEVRELSLVWHRLDPWYDSTEGIRALNQQFWTCTLSNGNMSLLEDLKAHGELDFTHIFSAELFGSYKPSPTVYLGAVERLGLQPAECAMVAAHLNDLKAAKSHGLQAIYVERAQEEDWAAEEIEAARSWVDLWVPLAGRGFLTVAERLGVKITGGEG
ncbi:haloacid dehalogenase [Polyplosphaeria fusca]|uniref:Haloacid dehalogenase n=1 Tax=Polyplosphaeria fusca TaxID=682080 RepID=A0A9P4UVT2_9PLEO|nr:haloacid dehalogenase [Polyplosphaeria fusca]